MLQLHPVYLLCDRRKTLTGSPDPMRANGTNKPCTAPTLFVLCTSHIDVIGFIGTLMSILFIAIGWVFNMFVFLTTVGFPVYLLYWVVMFVESTTIISLWHQCSRDLRVYSRVYPSMQWGTPPTPIGTNHHTIIYSQNYVTDDVCYSQDNAENNYKTS